MKDYKAEIEDEFRKNLCNKGRCRNCSGGDASDLNDCYHYHNFKFVKLIEARQEIDRLNNDLKQAL